MTTVWQDCTSLFDMFLHVEIRYCIDPNPRRGSVFQTSPSYEGFTPTCDSAWSNDFHIGTSAAIGSDR